LNKYIFVLVCLFVCLLQGEHLKSKSSRRHFVKAFVLDVIESSWEAAGYRPEAEAGKGGWHLPTQSIRFDG
jgi:hypothetical protein